MIGLYAIFIRLYGWAIRLAALKNPKARDWVAGRKGIFKELDSIRFKVQPFWIHAASLGEYLQAKPVIERLKATYPSVPIVLTFFSPSGYQNFKDLHLVDAVLYLPLDTRYNAQRWVQQIHPRAAFFIKYEFWPNYLDALCHHKVPYGFLAASFREDHPIFSWWGGFIKDRVFRASLITVQDPMSKRRLEQNGYFNTSLSGDSRFDQVFELAQDPKRFPKVEEFVDGHPVLMAGSCWPEDEEVILPQIMRFTRIKFIFAPHDISDQNIRRLIQSLPVPALRYSEIKDGDDLTEFRVLVIDNIGMLSHLYALATYAHVGGGYKQGLHNILEPAAHGNVVFFGPQIEKYWEASEIIRKKAGFPVKDAAEFTGLLKEFESDPTIRESARNAALEFVDSHRGSADRMMEAIRQLHLGLGERPTLPE